MKISLEVLEKNSKDLDTEDKFEDIEDEFNLK